MPARTGGSVAAVLAATLAAHALAAPPVLEVVGDGIPAPLPGAAAGDPARGRAIVANRQVGLCLLCHPGPIAEEPFQGNLAPALQGAGRRWSAAQLRLRIADASRIDPATIMPAYYRTDGLTGVAAAYRDRTILSAQQIEDVVAWLQTLTEPAP
jgi:sulfur-oxidizing protein SoxX